uniref:Uncharacterized protein n=1 Tax=viral metagenome TaxID=1070528 RepID=A0A6M3IRX7_9ZZZZ
MNFKELDQKLQGRYKQRRKLANNTYACRRGEGITIQLHATDIVTFKPNGDIVLKSGSDYILSSSLFNWMDCEL